MARRLQTVIYDIDPAPNIEAFHTGFALDATADRHCLHIPKKLTLKLSRTHFYRMRPLNGGGFTPNAPVIVTQAAHGGNLVREWAAIELFFEIPTNTTLRVRLHDGAGVSWYWDGGAWVIAGPTDWNTPADVVANFPTFAVTDALRLGVQWELNTTDKTVTPLVYGAMMAGRLMFAARSGDTASETRSDGWLDDLVHRVLIPWLTANLQPEVTDERETEDETSLLDYSRGIGEGETNYVVTDVQAVYDLDADPTMLTPLAGTWDPTDKTYTLDTPLPSCRHYAARVTYLPLIAYSGKADFFDSTLPQVLIEQIVDKSDRGSHGQLLVRDVANLQALALPYPRHRKLNLVALLQGDDHVNTWELAESIERITNGVGGVVLLSPNTGMPISVKMQPQLRPARGDQAVEAAARFDFQVWTREYHGQETTVPILKPDGFITTIVPAETVVARN